MNSNSQIDQFESFLQETVICLELSNDLEKSLLDLKINLQAGKELGKHQDWGHNFDAL